MGRFGSKDENDFDDDGPMFGGADRYEQVKSKRRLAEEIACGLVSGIMERDEEVWKMVKEIEESK